MGIDMLDATFLEDGYQTYVIDDGELDRIYESYPNLWKDKQGMSPME